MKHTLALFLARTKKHSWIFFLILLGLSLRLIRFPQNLQVNHMDFLGVYLTSHHMIAYKEFQFFGEANGVYAILPNSPFYDYLLSTFLLIKDSIWTLAIVNLLFQCISLVSLYGIAYLLFGKRVAILVGLYVALNQRFINQSQWVWQPTIAQPFFYGSYFFLVYSYIHKNIRALIPSVFLFIGAMGIGLYGMVLLPLFLIGIEITQRHIGITPYKRFILPLLCIGGSIFVYLPVLLHVMRMDQVLFFLHPDPYIDSIAHFLPRIVENITTVLSAVTRGTLPFFTWQNTVAMSIIMIETAFYLWHLRRSKRHMYAVSLFACIILTIVAASLLDESSKHRFVSITGLCIILLCEIVCSFWEQGKKYLTVIGIAALLSMSVVGPAYLHDVWNKPSISVQQERVVAAMLPTLNEIKHIYGPLWPEHFKIATYNITSLNNPAADTFWVLLEEKTQTKLTKIAYPGTWGHNFVPLGTFPSYVFIVCTLYETQEGASSGCLPKFAHDYPNHKNITMIYEGMGPFGTYHVYVAKPGS